MAAGEVQTTKIQTSLVSKWPEPIDINIDIFIPGKAERWSRELIAALRTRELYQWVSTTNHPVAYRLSDGKTSPHC